MMNSFSKLPEKVANRLVGAGFTSPNELLFVEDWKLQRVPGIGKATIKKIRIEYGPSFFNCHVKKQTSILGLSIEEFRIKKLGRMWVSPRTGNYVSPEDAVLDFFLIDGWEGSAFEGYPLTLLQEASCQDYINRNSESTFFCDMWLWLALKKGQLHDLIEPALSVDEETLRKNLLLLMDHREKLGTYDDARLEEEFLIRLWKNLGKETFRSIFERQIDDRGHAQFYAG